MVSTASSSQNGNARLVHQQRTVQRFFPPANGHNGANTNNNINNNNNSMGCRSQNRDGSIKACKKKATKVKCRYRNRVQRSMTGGLGFVAELHCKICKAKRERARGHDVSVPHRPHDPRCVENRKTRGLSEFTVFAEKTVKENIRINNAKIGADKEPEERTLRQFGSALNHFGKKPAQPASILPSADVNAGMVICQPVVPSANKRAKNQPNVTNVRDEIDERMRQLKSKQNYQWCHEKSESVRFPAPMTLAAHCICCMVHHAKHADTSKALPKSANFKNKFEIYKSTFKPGACEVAFPVDQSKCPSPCCHSVQGESLPCVDWKLTDPEVPLLCFNCMMKGAESNKCTLQHDRTNVSHSKSLFPIFKGNGQVIAAILMKHKCAECNALCDSNDGRLLSMLPAHMRKCYPARPKHAQGTFHLHQDFTDNLDITIRTHEGPNSVSKKLHRLFNSKHVDKVETCLSMSCTQDFVSFDDCEAGLLPPSPDCIRNAFIAAENCVWQSHGCSNASRHKREMQAFTMDENDQGAADWTFAPAKSSNEPGLKCAFTFNKGSTKEIATVLFVRSAAVSQVSHALTHAARCRKKFRPGGLHTDACPANTDFWQAVLGPHLEHRLGLFHPMQRIIDTLNNCCDLHWRCLVQLRACFCSCKNEDLAGLTAALRSGAFSRKGIGASEGEIEDAKHSKLWKQRHEQCLRKDAKSGVLIKQALAAWLLHWNDQSDGRGRFAFTKKTKETTELQHNNVDNASDVPGVQVCQEVPAGPRSTHGLSKFFSNRPEAHLELFHQWFAHCANANSKADLSDPTNLGGTTAHNAKARWKHDLNQQKLEGKIIDIPGHFEEEPICWDHSMLSFLNKCASAHGLLNVFHDVFEIESDNGEDFLTDHFKSQDVRNDDCGQDLVTKLCRCSNCQVNVPSARSVPIRTVPSVRNANENDPPRQAVQTPTNTSIVARNATVTMVPAPNPAPVAPLTLPCAVDYRVVSMFAPSQRCCYPQCPFCCQQKHNTLLRIFWGVQILGRHAHDVSCPTKKKNKRARVKKEKSLADYQHNL